VRSKSLPACVITGQLRAASGGATLATPIARVKVKAGKNATLRLRLTPAGRKRVRRGRKVRLLIADRTSAKAPLDLQERARAQAQVAIP